MPTVAVRRANATVNQGAVKHRTTLAEERTPSVTTSSAGATMPK